MLRGTSYVGDVDDAAARLGGGKLYWIPKSALCTMPEKRVAKKKERKKKAPHIFHPFFLRRSIKTKNPPLHFGIEEDATCLTFPKFLRL